MVRDNACMVSTEQGRIMNCGKVALFILILVVLDLTGCGQPRKGVAEKAQDDTVCIKRADLKLIELAAEFAVER